MARSSGIFIFDGNTSGSWADGRNFLQSDLTTRWAQNQYPGYDGATSTNVDGDTALISVNAVNALAGGDYSTKGKLAKLSITENYKKSDNTALAVGSSGTPLILTMQSTGSISLDCVNSGNIYLKGGGDGLYNVTVLNSKKTGTASTIYLDGTITNYSHLKGTVEIAATAVIAGTFKTGHIIGQNDAILTITAGATLPSVIECESGVIENNVALTTLNQTGGLWKQEAGNVANGNVRNGTLQWDGGDITGTLICSGSGVCDGSQSDVPRTLSADVYLNSGGRLRLDNNSQSITVTKPLHCDGGSFDVSPGTLCAISYGG